MRTHRRSALFLITALTALTVVPVAPAFATEVAPPETVTASVDGLEVAADAAAVVDAAGLTRVDEPAATDATETDVIFSTIGFRLPDGVDQIELRTRSTEGAWGEWFTVERVSPELDGPDAGSPNEVPPHAALSEPAWVGPSDAFQVALDAGHGVDTEDAVAALEAELIDTLGDNEGVISRTIRHLTPRPVVAPAEAAVGRPTITSRAGWGANESWRTWSTSYRTPTFAVLHHTAGSNNYSKAESPGVVRGIYSYHARTLGWGDIGYNALVDKYGRIYEGRAGGLHRGAIGAHAKGFNTGSFGVSIMGNYDTVDVPAVALESVARVTAWKYDLHGIDASATRTMSAHGKTINTLTAHRNIGSTACPGRYLYAKMGALRSRIASLVGSGTAPAPEPAAPKEPPTRFVDVLRRDTHYATIESAAERALTSGCTATKFCPNTGVTRGQLATFLVKAVNLPPAATTSTFEDVSGVHTASIAALAASGITAGCSPTRYCPHDVVTRAQAASLISAAFSIPQAREGFSDVSRWSTHAGAIGGLVEAEVISGYGDGTFRPQDPVTRAAMATLLVRALDR
ncbi:MAG: S-layer homology domain-containing protein [Nitriliruptor sp.]